MAHRGAGFSFDPVALGRAECATWVAYYRRDWPRMLAGALGMVRHGFALGPVRDVVAAWHVMQANRAWAPIPGNDPGSARRSMARFYRLTRKAGRLDVDPEVAAKLEVAWWHAHREHQHDAGVSREMLVSTLVMLYAYLHHAHPDEVRPAADLRVQAMDLSDTWVRNGRRLDDPALARERLALVASFTALREVSDRAVIHK